jgi:hypothetical protein
MEFNEKWYSEQQSLDLCKLAESVINLQGDFIEIGCWEGRSTHKLTNTIYPQILLCNDTWEGNAAESEVTGVRCISQSILESRDVFTQFQLNMKELTQGNFSIIKQDCLEWLPTLTTKVKFCHIDASHDYVSVYKTIELLKPHLVEGAILCGDDFESANMYRDDLQGGVEKAVRELLPNFKNKQNLWYWSNTQTFIDL